MLHLSLTVLCFQSLSGKTKKGHITCLIQQSKLILCSCHARRGQWHPTPVLLPGGSHGWRSLEGCSPWGCWGLDTIKRLHFHFSLSCIGEGNGNPLQCSCLESPRDREAWWAAIYGVAQSRTRLKWLSRLFITFLPKSKHLLISWLQSPSAVILESPQIKSDTVV